MKARAAMSRALTLYDPKRGGFAKSAYLPDYSHQQGRVCMSPFRTLQGVRGLAAASPCFTDDIPSIPSRLTLASSNLPEEGQACASAPEVPMVSAEKEKS